MNIFTLEYSSSRYNNEGCNLNGNYCSSDHWHSLQWNILVQHISWSWRSKDVQKYQADKPSFKNCCKLSWNQITAISFCFPNCALTFICDILIYSCILSMASNIDGSYCIFYIFLQNNFSQIFFSFINTLYNSNVDYIKDAKIVKYPELRTNVQLKEGIQWLISHNIFKSSTRTFI